MFKRKTVLIIISTLLLATSIIVAGLLVYKWQQIKKELEKQTEQNINLVKQIEVLQKEIDKLQEEIKKPKVEKTEDEIPNWKTYRNEVCGFEINYPKEWENPPIDDSDCSYFNFTCFPPENLAIAVNTYHDLWEGIECIDVRPADWECIDSGEEIIVEGIKISPIIHSRLKGKLLPQDDISKEECDEISVGKFHVIYADFCVDEDNKYLDMESCQPKERERTFYYQIFLMCEGDEWEGKEGRDKCSQLFDQIVSTFRFIEK